MSRVLGDVSYDLDPKVKGQIMYLLVNASPHKFLEVAAVHRSHDVEGTRQHFM